jgi:hypothetical protein
MANLNDVLQGLVTTDNKVIDKLKKKMSELDSEIDNLNNKVNTEIADLQSKIDNDLEDLTEKVSRGSGSYALLDINSPDITGSGTKKTDTSASHGQCYSATAGSSAKCIYSSTFSEINFGHYALCVRAKTNAVGTKNIVRLKVLNGSTEILSQDFIGNSFSNTTGYDYLYSTFTYESTGSTKNDLKFEIYVLPVSGVSINFDYAYISMIIPSVYV